MDSVRGGNPTDGDSLLGRSVGRYRIDAFVDHGGMGDVFKGWDTHLDRTVAVKALRRDLVSEPRSRQRFVRESRYASRVQHPFVCSVLDVVEDREEIFLVMEYVEGRGLDVVVQDDHPSADRVRDLAIEIAEALGAIHGAGIVHRDLKPSNVMLTGDGHVKVMDFGVARLSAPQRSPDGSDATMTETGFGVGTIAYMSPEQIRGHKADARSDLFALGIVLYQAITGEHPFERGSPYATASAILNDPPGGGHEPETLSTAGATRQIVMRLLEKEPAQRYATSEDLLRDLKAAKEGLRLAPLPKPTPRFGRATVWTAAALILAAGVAGYSWWRWGREKPVDVPARPAVVVLPFDESATDPEADLRGWMIADLIAADLDASGRVRRIPLDRLADVLHALPPDSSAAERGRRITAATGARWVVSGRLYPTAEGFELAAEIRDGKSGDEASQALRLRGSTSTALADVAGGRLLAAFGLGSHGRAASFDPAYLGSSSSEKARTLEQRARRALRAERIRDAIELFRGAIAEDAQFLLARAGLAEALLRGGWETDARRVAGEASEMAAARGGRLAEAVAARVQSVRDRVLDDREAEIRTLSRLVERTPDDADGWFDLGSAYFGVGKNEEAKTALERALAIEPSFLGAALRRALALGKLGHADLAGRALRDAADGIAKVAGDYGRARVAQTSAQMARLERRYEDAANGYDESVRLFLAAGAPGAAAITRADLGNALVLVGRYDDAIRVLRDSVSTSRALGQPKQTVVALWALGNALLQVGHRAEAEARLRDALAESSGLGNPRLDAYVKTALAGQLVSDLRPVEARSLAEDVLETARSWRIPALESNALSFIANAEFQHGNMENSRATLRAILSRTGEPEFESQFDYAWLSLAELEEAVGSTSEALQAASEAHRLHREAGQDELRAYAATFLGRIHAQLGDTSAATAAIDEAAAVAAKMSADTRKPLEARVAFARAYLAWSRGRPAEALRLLQDPAVDPEGDPAQSSLTRTLRAVALLESGRPADALAVARAVVESPVSLATSRLSCGALSAEAEHRLGRTEHAAALARSALADARRMRSHLEAARCALVALEADADALDRAALALTARAEFDAYLAAAPASKRTSLQARPQIRELQSRLSKTLTAS